MRAATTGGYGWMTVTVAACTVLLLVFPGHGGAQARDDVLAAANHARAAHGLPALRFDPALYRTAAAKRRALVRTGVFSHDAGPGLVAPAECLAWWNRWKPRHVVVEWLRSPVHRRLLLDRRYGTAAVAVSRPHRLYGVDHVTVFVLHLGFRKGR
jgi:uncharacterized protein YkwD